MAEMTVMPLELRQTGEMTLEGLAVPYGATTRKAGYASGERFLPGAFSGATAPNVVKKIRLTDSHDRTGKRPVGVATELRDTPEGLYSTFRFFKTPEGRGAWENVVEETYGGLSVGFVATKEQRGADGAREVVAGQLHHVSLVDEPAYEEAKIVAVRAALPDVSELLAVKWDLDEIPEAPDLSSMLGGVRTR